MEPRTNPIKHVLWDWNGTLLDDLWLAIRAINIILDRYQLPRVDETTYLDIFDFPVKDYYVKLGFDFKKTPFEIVGTEFIEEYTRRMTQPHLRKGSRQCLDRLHDLGVNQSLFSAGKLQMLHELLDFHQLKSYFDDVIGQTDHYAHGKTDSGRQWLTENSVDPESVVFIGDTLHDLDVAEELGFDGVIITGGHTSESRIHERTDKVFESMDALESWLLASLNGQAKNGG